MTAQPRRRVCFARLGLALTALALATGCGQPLNNPYPDAASASNTLYEAFTETPRHLDPARSYAANEVQYTDQIYEPPLQYHYLKRPYQLIPRSAIAVPEPALYDADGKPLPDDAPDSAVATSVYTIRVQPGIRYQPHPAFATGDNGKPLYFDLTDADVAGFDSPADFAHQGSRELAAGDFVHEIKRLADPNVHSPIAGVMREHIVGFGAFAKRLSAARKKRRAAGNDAPLDLTRFQLKGVRVVDDHSFIITIDKRYPQLRYWLAMPFFAPVPPEVTRFYRQQPLIDRNITLDTYPVGTGPYMMVENNPNRRIVLKANPNFHGETYPAQGEPRDRAAGLLDDAGKPLPFIDRVVFSLEKESIPYWNKFLQGYYDASGISSDSFGEAIRIDADGEPHLTAKMRQRGMSLHTAVAPSVYYLGFNMHDPVVGGYGEKARKLRRAVSIALDYESFIAIFLNGRGIAAQGPIPKGIFGYRDGRAGMNPYVYDWEDGEARRKSLDTARRLLAEAGYPGGVDADSGNPLLLNLDTAASGPQFKSQMDWYRKQLAELNIQLVVRSTTWNRFQQKMADGNVQLFASGWQADYPDPENFLFLLYGPNGAAEHHGENVANYDNPQFNRLFRRMRDMDNGPERQAVIDRMLRIVQRDAPWAWGFYPRQYTLHQAWLGNGKLNPMANNTLKYLRLDPWLRAQERRAWNDPVLWPLPVAAGLFLLALIPGVVGYLRRERQAPREG